MRQDVILTCALTGAGDTTAKNPHVPVTPEAIVADALEAHEAGAAVVHIHVRDPETKQAARRHELYAEVMQRLRDSGSEVIVNLTAGMGGDFAPDAENPAQGGPGTDMATAHERVAHVLDLKPEICTLDCGSLNFPDAAYVATPDQLREMAQAITSAGIKPEIECFELGHIWLAKTLLAEGYLNHPPLFQLCMGIPFGAEATPMNMLCMRDNLPQGSQWAAFGIGRMQMPFAAQSALLGGHVRVGLEDNIYLEKGVPATNAQLVTKARTMLEAMGCRLLDANAARDHLGLA